MSAFLKTIVQRDQQGQAAAILAATADEMKTARAGSPRNVESTLAVRFAAVISGSSEAWRPGGVRVRFSWMRPWLMEGQRLSHSHAAQIRRQPWLRENLIGITDRQARIAG